MEQCSPRNRVKSLDNNSGIIESNLDNTEESRKNYLEDNSDIIGQIKIVSHELRDITDIIYEDNKMKTSIKNSDYENLKKLSQIPLPKKEI